MTETETHAADRETEQPTPEQQEILLTSDQVGTLQQIAKAFASNVPTVAVTHGSYDMLAAHDQEEALAGNPSLLPIPPIPEATDVPDGRYRVEGQDWIITVAAGVATLFERGGPHTDPDTVTAVPPPLPGVPPAGAMAQPK